MSRNAENQQKKTELDSRTEADMKPLMAWVMKHDLISSSVFTLFMGLLIGGAAMVMEWLFL